MDSLLLIMLYGRLWRKMDLAMMLVLAYAADATEEHQKEIQECQAALRDFQAAEKRAPGVCKAAIADTERRLATAEEALRQHRLGNKPFWRPWQEVDRKRGQKQKWLDKAVAKQEELVEELAAWKTQQAELEAAKTAAVAEAAKTVETARAELAKLEEEVAQGKRSAGISEASQPIFHGLVQCMHHAMDEPAPERDHAFIAALALCQNADRVARRRIEAAAHSGVLALPLAEAADAQESRLFQDICENERQLQVNAEQFVAQQQARQDQLSTQMRHLSTLQTQPKGAVAVRPPRDARAGPEPGAGDCGSSGANGDVSSSGMEDSSEDAISDAAAAGCVATTLAALAGPSGQ